MTCIYSKRTEAVEMLWLTLKLYPESFCAVSNDLRCGEHPWIPPGRSSLRWWAEPGHASTAPPKKKRLKCCDRPWHCIQNPCTSCRMTWGTAYIVGFLQGDHPEGDQLSRASVWVHFSPKRFWKRWYMVLVFIQHLSSLGLVFSTSARKIRWELQIATTIMKTLIRSLFWNAFAFVGTSLDTLMICVPLDLFTLSIRSYPLFLDLFWPRHVQDVDYECVLIFQSDETWHDVCEIGPKLEIDPDPDEVYRITVYAGFSIDDTDLEVLSKFKEQYAWKEVYTRVHWNYFDCLKNDVDGWLFLSLSRWHSCLVDLDWFHIAITFPGLNQIDQCSQSYIDNLPVRNPYYFEKQRPTPGSVLVDDFDDDNEGLALLVSSRPLMTMICCPVPQRKTQWQDLILCFQRSMMSQSLWTMMEVSPRPTKEISSPVSSQALMAIPCWQMRQKKNQWQDLIRCFRRPIILQSL